MAVSKVGKRSGKYRRDTDRHPARTRLCKVISTLAHVGDVRFPNRSS